MFRVSRIAGARKYNYLIRSRWNLEFAIGYLIFGIIITNAPQKNTLALQLVSQ